jgi:hypothetical protein
VNFGAQEFGERISRLQIISENDNMLCHDMQPNALLIWQNFILIKSGCYNFRAILEGKATSGSTTVATDRRHKGANNWEGMSLVEETLQERVTMVSATTIQGEGGFNPRSGNPRAEFK